MSSIKRVISDVESWYPSAAAALLAILVAVLLSLERFKGWKPVFDRGATALIPAALNISAIAIGFLATSLSILLSLGGTKVAAALKATGHHRRLVGFFRRGISVSFLWALISALLATVDLTRGGVWRNSILYFWVLISFWSILCYYRASEILLEVLMVDSAPPRDVRPEWNPEDNEPPIQLDLTSDDK